MYIHFLLWKKKDLAYTTLSPTHAHTLPISPFLPFKSGIYTRILVVVFSVYSIVNSIKACFSFSSFLLYNLFLLYSFFISLLFSVLSNKLLVCINRFICSNASGIPSVLPSWRIAFWVVPVQWIFSLDLVECRAVLGF